MSKPKIVLSKTGRGFAIAEFKDIYDKSCTLQKSSLAGIDAIWFGAGEERMHLSRDHVKALLPYLNKFAETGEL